jgi:hypothetical protein
MLKEAPHPFKKIFYEDKVAGDRDCQFIWKMSPHTHRGSGGTALWWVSVAPSEWGTTDE